MNEYNIVVSTKLGHFPNGNDLLLALECFLVYVHSLLQLSIVSCMHGDKRAKRHSLSPLSFTQTTYLWRPNVPVLLAVTDIPG